MLVKVTKEFPLLLFGTLLHMSVMGRGFSITSEWADIRPLLPQITAAADAERAAFGFMPRRAYEQFLVQKRLLVAVSPSQQLMGYLAYGGTFPQARIFQTYVSGEFRRSGVGKALVEAMVGRAEKATFLSIKAEVAADLEKANQFYASLGFRVALTKAGGRTTGRSILVRVRELETPSLLDIAAYGDLRDPPISISLPIQSRPPLYIVDLNVLFDVAKRRGRAAAAGRIFSAALENSIALAVSEEFVSELERHTPSDGPDPILELAKSLPRLRRPSRTFIQRLTQELSPILFPARHATDRLTEQDRSDIVHIATAVEASAKGFVTSERALLGASDMLREKYGLDIISPEVLGQHYAAELRSPERYLAGLKDRSLWSSEPSDDDIHDVRKLLAEQEVPEHVIRQALDCGSSVSPRRRLILKSSDGLVAFGSWSVPKPAEVARRLFVFVRPDSPSAELAVSHILNLATNEGAANKPSVLRLNPDSNQVLIRSLAIRSGFRPTAGSTSRVGKLERVTLRSVVTHETWPETRRALSEAIGLTLPNQAPGFASETDPIRLVFDGGGHAVTTIGSLEDLLAPAVFALRERAGVIVPITQRYAEELFRGSRQPLLEGTQAALLNERRYMAHARTYRVIPEQGLLFFYESSRRGGRSAATAVARIRRRYLAEEDRAKELASQKGVLPSRAIEAIARGKQICVVEFDSLHQFPFPVGLQALKEIGCADGANLVTARKLGPEALSQLVRRGFDGS